MNGRALVAWNLRRIRAGKGVSQERLAADAGVDRAYVSEIEREQGNVTVDLLDRVAQVLGCDLADFFVAPRPDEPSPKLLRQGRKPRAG